MKRLLFLACLLLWSVPAFATTYYVNKSGSNGNSCATAQSPTDANAKLTIAAGIACMASGDTLLIGDGTYVESVSNLIPSGSMGALTIIQAENANQAIIHPSTSGSAPWYDAFVLSDDSWIVLDGLYIDGDSVMNNALRLNGTSSNNIIRNGTIVDGGRGDAGNSGNCIYLQDTTTTDNTIQNMTLTNCGTIGSGQEHGIYIIGPDNIIDGNTITGASGYGIHNYSGGATGDRTIIRNNRVVNSGARGILGGNGDNQFIYNNVVTGSTSFGIEIGYGDNNSVYNNTIYGGSSRCIYSSFSVGTVTRNNICWNNTTNTIVDDGTGGATSNNICTSGCASSNDPLFTNAAGGDFTLTSSSPAIDTGTDISATCSGCVTDIIGTGRPAGGGWDIGAYEFTSGVVPPPSTVQYDNSCTGVNSGASISFSCTAPSSSNTAALLWVAIGTGTDTTVSSVPTYNSVAMGTDSICTADNTSGGFGARLYTYALAAPTAGSHTVSVTLSDTPGAAGAGIMFFHAVNQTNVFRSAAQTIGTGGTVTGPVSSSPGDLIATGAYRWNVNPVVVSPQTQRFDLLFDGDSSDLVGGTQQASGGTSTSPAWTWDGSDRWGICPVSLIPLPTTQPNFKNIFSSSVIR